MEFIEMIMYLSIYLGLIAMSFYILSYVSGKKKKLEFYTDDELPKVTVIIPAYNEEKTIESTIKSILQSDYPIGMLEIIVVNDGSTDDTLKIAKTFLERGVKIFSKENGGKASALNFAIKRAKGDIIFTMDADTLVESYSLKNMVRHFKNKEIMSVTPAIIIHEPKTIWQRVQQIEYVFGLFLRKTFSILNAIYITPGAFSAYRKIFFKKHGDFDEGNITEDLEMSLRIQYNGYRVGNSSHSPAYTIAPADFYSTLKQRRRWYVGLIRNMSSKKYRKIISKKYGDLGMFVMPIAGISIFFAVFITIFFVIKTLFKVAEEMIFWNRVNFDFFNLFNINFYFFERFFFLFFTNFVVLFILLFIILMRIYIVFARKRIGKINQLYVNLPLFFIFFAVLFGFWWIVSIVYALFKRKVVWK